MLPVLSPDEQFIGREIAWERGKRNSELTFVKTFLCPSEAQVVRGCV